MARFLLIGTLGLLVFAGCSDEQTSPDERVVGLYGGDAGFSPVLSPTKVEAFRVKNGVFQPDEEPQPLGGYPVTAGPVEVDKETADQLIGILRDSSTYMWDSAKGCEFQPGVAIRFTDDSGVTEVVFCFECDGLKVFRGNERVGGIDFDDGRDRLIAVMKLIFPDDAEIQALN